MSISFAATPQSKEAQQARTYTDPSRGAPPSRRSGANAPYIDKDHWNKIFTEPEYFDSIAKQKGMAEGAKVSLFGDDYVYRQAMIGYMSATRGVPLDDMRKVFDVEKDAFAQKNLGKKTASAREMFDWQKSKFERENEKQAAARQILNNVAQRAITDFATGGDTAFVESVAKDIDAAGDMFSDEEKSMLWEKAEENDMKLRATQMRFAPEAKFIFDALRQTTGEGAGFGAPDMREMATRFAKLPDNQRKAIYELAGSFAQLNQTDKGFWYQMAESLGRGASDIVERVPRNIKEQALRNDLRMLEGDQPVFAGTGVQGTAYSAFGTTPLTPEERQQAAEKVRGELGVFKVERELRDLAERVIDPIKTVTVLPEIVEEGLYGAARSLPYTAVAAVPYAGAPAVAGALYSSNYDRIMLEYPDIDPDKAALIAAISAPIEAGLERMKVNTIMGRLPFFGGLVKRFQHPNQRNITRIAIGGAGVLAEQNAQEILQNATFPFVQMIGSVLDKDIPEYNLDLASMPRDLAVQFVALLPLSLMGIGALSHREISRGEAYLRNKDNLEKAGYSEEQIDRITGAATADEAQSVLREESKKRDPEKVKAAAQRIVDEAIALREKANPAALPRLEKQGADYVVLSPEGKELARERDQTAAEQALVSARRETVQREMRDVHTGINEAVEFIKKVNEARQRGEDIAKVIRENAPRTLLTDYEANPTQENLDRLFETVRAFGQEINEPAELANFPVTGSNQGALAEGIWRSVIRINEGADGTIVMREFAQDNLKRAIAEGRVTMDFVRQQLNDILPQIDSDRMERRLRTDTDTDVIEAFSDIAVAYFRGSIREEQIPAGLRGIMRRLAIATRDIFRRAYNLARLRAEGKLDRDFEALLAEAVGVDQQALVDRARERTEQEVGAQQNYSIGELLSGKERQRRSRIAIRSNYTDESGLFDLKRAQEFYRQQQEIVNEQRSKATGVEFYANKEIAGQAYSAIRQVQRDFDEYRDYENETGRTDLILREPPDIIITQDILDARKAGLPTYKAEVEPMWEAIAGKPSDDTFLVTIDTGDGKRAGRATVRISPDYDNTLEIKETEVFLEFRSKGFGEALYREIAKFAQSRGLTEIHSDQVSPAAARVRAKLFAEPERPDYFPYDYRDKTRDATTGPPMTSLVDPTANYSIAVTPKQDADYLAAVERGDMETAQRMVDEAAIAAGYDIGPVYHGTPSGDFAEFESDKVGGRGFYFAKRKEYAGMYARGESSKIISAYLNLKNPISGEDFQLYGTQGGLSKAEAVEMAKQDGFDGIDSQGAFVAFNPNQIKSADPVTYDASGNVITLSQRFDATTADINYSIGSRAQPDVERNVITLPDVTISGPANYSIGAWHGSPAEFDEFDLGKLGTGEGAQVYGWGLYFAQQKDTAAYYRDQLSKANASMLLDGVPYEGRRNDLASNVDMLIADAWHSMPKTYRTKDELVRELKSRSKSAFKEWKPIFKLAIAKAKTEAVEFKHPAYLYSVDLNVEPEELLDWDKPFDEQSEAVKTAFESVRQHYRDTDGNGFYISGTGEQIYNEITNTKNQYGNTLSGWNEILANAASDGFPAASDFLLSLGIKGIRYLDQGSRGAQFVFKYISQENGRPTSLLFDTLEDAQKEQKDYYEYYPDAPKSEIVAEAATYNYVIFDDSLIKILTRNGEQISVEQAAQEVSNYSISTQSEIDRVSAAMGALDRSPLSRLKIYEKMQERFLRVMADNRETLAAMEGGDLSQVRRTQILQALGELDGIISALPAEIRSKIGGYTQLAKVDPMDVFKGDQKVSEVRGMSGAIISAWMREGLNIGEAQKKTELPAGYRAERNLDPTRADRAIADVFIQRINRINEALEKFLRDEYNDAAVELFKRAKPQRSGAGEKPKGKLGADVHALFDTLKEATEWSAEEAQAWADGQWSRIEAGELNPYEEAHATLAAQVIPLFADWANADSTQRAAAVAMGKDILDRAYKGEQQRIIAQRTKRGYDRTDLSKDAGVSAEDDKARQNAVKRENSLPAKWEAAMLNLLNFDQVLRYVFGNDSKIAQKISDRQRKADNAKSDDVAALSDEWATFLTMLGGGQMEGQQLLFDLSRMDEEIDGVAYSQNQLVAITMMWMQPKGRQHMEGFMDSDGQPAGKWHYNQAFVNKAEKLLRPESKAIREYLLRKYDEEYDALNKVYRKVYGLNLPKNQFYSPLVVESIAAPAQAGIDPVTGGVFAAGANSPSALRSRGGAIAQPVFRDAVQTYFGHMLQMAHWKAYAEFNSEVSALLGHRDTRNVVKGKAGEQAATVMNNWLQYFQQGGNKDAANHLAINQWINRMTGNFAAISLFGRVSTLALQVTQLGAASAKMPVGAYLSRFGKLMSGRLEWKTALDSDYIQRRIKDMPPAVALAMQGLRAEKPSQIRNAARWLGQHLSGFDGFFTAGTYAIVYDYQLSQARQNGMGGQEAADYAREATERIVDEIAQPTRAGARSIYELNSTNPVARAVWAFSSESRKNMGLLMYNGAKGGSRNFGEALTYVLLLNGLVGIVIRNAFRDMRDDDDDEVFDEKNWGWKRLAAQFISDPIYGIPVVGETIESGIYAAFSVYQPTGPVFDVTRGIPAAKRLGYDHPMALLEGEAEFRDIVADVNRILAAAGLFNSNIAAAASISNLAKDVFEVTDNALGDE